MHLPKAWLSDCVTSRFMRSLCWDFFDPYVLLIRQPSKAENHALQCTTAGQYNAILSTLLGVGSVCGLGPDLVGVFTPPALRLAIELLHARPRFATALRKSIRLVDTIALLFSLSLLCGKKDFSHLPWLAAPRTLSILFVAWTVMANLMFQKKQSEGCHWASC